ncbi:MAG: deoxyribodipyrimidine photo-lyase, partial [Cyanothece sp. SIO1E1]|nr:deoxyribodipyrimidine photo-lyase [Cyanothece sp. SIO1E1]
MNCTLVWFRRDLRIADHAPLHRAARRGLVVPVFVLDPFLLHHPETAVARVSFMLKCLQSLDEDLRQRGGRLILRSGNPVQVLPDLIRATQADGIYAYIDYERIYGRVRDAQLNQALQRQELKIRWFEPIGGVPDLISYPQYRQFWFQDMQAELVPTPQQARQRRVARLEKQRQPFLGKQNVVPFLARLPERWTPFGSDRIPAQVGWAKSQHLSLFP